MAATFTEAHAAEGAMHNMRKDLIVATGPLVSLLIVTEMREKQSVLVPYLITAVALPAALVLVDVLPGRRMLDKAWVSDWLFTGMLLGCLASGLPTLLLPTPGAVLRFFSGNVVGIWLCGSSLVRHRLLLLCAIVVTAAACALALLFGATERLVLSDVGGCGPTFLTVGFTYAFVRFRLRIHTRRLRALRAVAEEKQRRKQMRRERRQAVKNDLLGLYLLCRHFGTLPPEKQRSFPGGAMLRVASYLCREAARDVPD